MSDEGLDSMFKNGLGKRDVKFDMGAWRRMEEMLPPEPKTKGFRMGYAAAVIGVLLITTASVFIWNEVNSELGVDGYSTANTTIENIDVERIVSSNSDETASKPNTSKQVNVSVSEITKETVEASNSSDARNENSTASTSSTNSTFAMRNATKVSYNKGASNSLFAGNRNSSSGFFDNITEVNQTKYTRDNSKPEESLLLASNSFTKIEGIGELAIKSNNEETNVLVANVTNSGMPKVAKNVVGFIGGVNLNQGLVESSNTGITGSEFFGLEYERYLNGGVSIRANLLYSAKSGINTQKVYDKKYYDFGSRTEQTTVECQRMVYLELPVLLNYSVANHNFMVGPSFSYLVSGLNKVSTTYESKTEIITDESSVWGYTNGFKSYDVALVAGYEYSVKPKLNLGVRLNYGLIDVTDNDYFGNTSFDNNVQLRVYLKFSPFQF